MVMNINASSVGYGWAVFYIAILFTCTYILNSLLFAALVCSLSAMRQRAEAEAAAEAARHAARLRHRQYLLENNGEEDEEGAAGGGGGGHGRKRKRRRRKHKGRGRRLKPAPDGSGQLPPQLQGLESADEFMNRLRVNRVCAAIHPDATGMSAIYLDLSRCRPSDRRKMRTLLLDQLRLRLVALHGQIEEGRLQQQRAVLRKDLVEYQMLQVLYAAALARCKAPAAATSGWCVECVRWSTALMLGGMRR
jgi:hypothetical protein